MLCKSVFCERVGLLFEVLLGGLLVTFCALEKDHKKGTPQDSNAYSQAGVGSWANKSNSSNSCSFLKKCSFSGCSFLRKGLFSETCLGKR